MAEITSFFFAPFLLERVGFRCEPLDFRANLFQPFFGSFIRLFVERLFLNLQLDYAPIYLVDLVGMESISILSLEEASSMRSTLCPGGSGRLCTGARESPPQ